MRELLKRPLKGGVAHALSENTLLHTKAGFCAGPCGGNRTLFWSKSLSVFRCLQVLNDRTEMNKPLSVKAGKQQPSFITAIRFRINREGVSVKAMFAVRPPGTESTGCPFLRRIGRQLVIDGGITSGMYNVRRTRVCSGVVLCRSCRKS